MSTDHPVAVTIHSPTHFDRIQLVLRIAIAVAMAWLGFSAGWLAFMLYATLPIIAAVAISSTGSVGYLGDFAPGLWRVLRWLVQLSAYMMLVVDRFPTADDGVEVAIHFTGKPTIGSALIRLVTSVPSALLLSVLWVFAAISWLVAFGLVLIGGPVPPAVLAFPRGVVRWQARLLAYHASLIEEYPPFHLDTSDELPHAGHHAA